MLMLDNKGHISIYDVVRVARHGEQVGLTDSAKEAINHSRTFVEKILAENQVVYGISTGFGEFSKVTISGSDRELLQRNLILSHCVGVGNFLPVEAIRGIILLRANSLARGYSGIRLSTVEKLIELLNKGITPAVPEKGSVGASGDLAPLSHMAAVLLGEGFVLVDGKAVPARPVLDAAGFEPIELAAKEGLALINGTQTMTSVGALACYDAEQLLKVADIACGLSLEALQGLRAAFDPRIAEIRPHQGQIQCAENMRTLTEGSAIIANYKGGKVQDAYSLRCASQVHGASREALRRVKETLDIEMNSVTDNPIVMADTGEIISGGNFHGQPMALVMDYLKLAVSEIGNISERRMNRLVDPHLSGGLPAFLIEKGGVNSGHMIAQYTAAALVSENKVLVHPASADSVPTSANQEDHVSMGTIASRQAREILGNVQFILAIELLSAAQGVDFLAPNRPAKGTGAAYDLIRTVVTHMDEDRLLHPDIEAVHRLVADESLVKAVEGAVGTLN